MEPKDNEGDDAPKIDAFGAPIDPIVPPAKEEPKDDKGDDKGKKEVDIDNHPSVVTLKKELADATKKLTDYSGNLSGQNKVIEGLKKQITELAAGGARAKDAADDVDIHKNIRTSKDLSKEERDNMTDAEIKAFDEVADLKKGMNELAKLVRTATKKEEPATVTEEDKEPENKGIVDDADTVENFKTEAKSVAATLAKGDVEMANKIIHEFNQFAGNDTLTKTQLAERMAKAASLVEGYTPPKEASRTPGPKGAPVKTGTDKNDPFGVASIVEGAKNTKAGGYAL